MKKDNNVRINKKALIAVIYIAAASAIVFFTAQSIGKITNGGYIPDPVTLNEGDIGSLEIPKLDGNILFVDVEKEENSDVTDTAEENKQEDLQNNSIITANSERNVDSTVEETNAESQQTTTFVRPADGYICREYSPTELIYSQTMYDYRTHNGVDLAADTGSAVLAFSSGVIEKIYNDEMFGTCIEIRHEDGLVSVYRNLYEEVPKEIKAGAKVNAGDVIAGVGETAICESADVPHLHFELYKDGKVENPGNYFE